MDLFFNLPAFFAGSLRFSCIQRQSNRADSVLKVVSRCVANKRCLVLVNKRCYVYSINFLLVRPTLTGLTEPALRVKLFVTQALH